MGTIEPYASAKGKRYRVRYRRPDHRQTTKRGFVTKREAEQYLATVEVAKLRGEWVDPTRSRVTVGELAEEWLAGRVRVKESTRDGYRRSLDTYVLPRWGGRRLAEVGHGEVQTWVSELAEKLAPSTVKQVFHPLRATFKYAVRDGRIIKNPTEGIQTPRNRAVKRGYLSHDQVRTLASECGGDADLIAFLAYTGLRWGEMAALRVRSIDFERSRVQVDESLTEVSGRLVRGTPKTHERRSVPLPLSLLFPLRARASGRGREDPLFATLSGLELRGNNFRKRVYIPALARAQATDRSMATVTLHDLRHTAASLAISAGANVKAVQRLLGHASAAMTLDVYADLFDDDLDAVAERLDVFAQANVASLWSSDSGELNTAGLEK